MQAFSLAASGTRASSASLNSAFWHQHGPSGAALSITQAFGPPQIGQLKGARLKPDVFFVRFEPGPI